MSLKYIPADGSPPGLSFGSASVAVHLVNGEARSQASAGFEVGSIEFTVSANGCASSFEATLTASVGTDPQSRDHSGTPVDVDGHTGD